MAAQAQYEFFAAAPAERRERTRRPVVVAVSGGADSVCLLHALRQLADSWHLTLHVAHIDHNLRPQSAADRAFVCALAARYQLPLHLAVLDPSLLYADPSGLEAAARHARYQFLCQVARTLTTDGGAACVAVAHHAGDQAETVLLHLVQGSGLRGLGGLRPVAPAPEAILGPVVDAGPEGAASVRLVRPLLDVEQAVITAYLERHALAWVEDESNLDLRFSRNYVRHVVLPALAVLNPNIVTTLGRSANLLAAEAERSELADAATLHQLAVTSPTATRVVLDLVRWQALPPATQRGVLRSALRQLAADRRQLNFDTVEQIVREATPRRSSGPHPLPAALAWSVAGASAGQPARLCLHKAGVPPLAIEYPYLSAAWRRAAPVWPLPLPASSVGEVGVGDWKLVVRRLPAAALPAGWQEQPAPWRLVADAAAVGAAALTTPTAGLRIAPLGMEGHHRLVADILSSHKIPPSIRPGWPLLVDRRDGQVLWVCGLRSAESLRVSAHTREVVWLEWQPDEGQSS